MEQQTYTIREMSERFGRGAAPADRHHRLRKRHGAAGTKRHSADFCHLGCKQIGRAHV